MLKEKGISHYVFGEAEESSMPLHLRYLFHNEITNDIFVSLVCLPDDVLSKWGQEHQGEDMTAITFDGHTYISLTKAQEIHPDGAGLLLQLEKGLRERIKELSKVTWYGDGQGVVLQ